MQQISKKQLKILQTIRSFLKEHNYPPTVRELAAAVGLSSSSTVHGHLNRLKERGLIEWQSEHPRTINIRA